MHKSKFLPKTSPNGATVTCLPPRKTGIASAPLFAKTKPTLKRMRRVGIPRSEHFHGRRRSRTSERLSSSRGFVPCNRRSTSTRSRSPSARQHVSEILQGPLRFIVNSKGDFNGQSEDVTIPVDQLTGKLPVRSGNGVHVAHWNPPCRRSDYDQFTSGTDDWSVEPSSSMNWICRDLFTRAIKAKIHSSFVQPSGIHSRSRCVTILRIFVPSIDSTFRTRSFCMGRMFTVS